MKGAWESHGIAKNQPIFVWPHFERLCNEGDDSTLMKQINTTILNLMNIAGAEDAGEDIVRAQTALRAYHRSLELAGEIVNAMRR